MRCESSNHIMIGTFSLDEVRNPEEQSTEGTTEDVTSSLLTLILRGRSVRNRVPPFPLGEKVVFGCSSENCSTKNFNFQIRPEVF